MPDPPDPGPGEVLVKLHAVGICGSDMHWYLDGGIGTTPANYPQVLGHEPAGEIIEVGKGVHHRKIGDRVSIEPSITCGHCEFCLSGHTNNCVQSVFMGGPQMAGLFREYAVLPAHNTDLIPSNLDWRQATLIEPVAVMVHLLELIDIKVGDTVAVMGAGPIGMLCASTAKLAGASRVYVCDKVPHRLAMSRQMGADVALDIQQIQQAVMDETRGRGVDIVLDAAGAPETINLGFALARSGGTSALIGIPSTNSVLTDINLAMAKELTIQTLKRSNHKGAQAAALLEAGRISDAIITHFLPLEQTPKGFEMLTTYSDGVGKVVIEV